MPKKASRLFSDTSDGSRSRKAVYCRRRIHGVDKESECVQSFTWIYLSLYAYALLPEPGEDYFVPIKAVFRAYHDSRPVCNADRAIIMRLIYVWLAPFTQWFFLLLVKFHSCVHLSFFCCPQSACLFLQWLFSIANRTHRPR